MTGKLSERRMYPRRGLPLPATARGRDARGAGFECAVLLHNISEGGIYMRISRCIETGSEMEVRLSLSPDAKGSSAGAEVCARGTVLRVDPQPLETCDVAVQFTRPLKI